jgi:hypothetical protein
VPGPGIGVIKVVINGRIGSGQTWSTGCFFSNAGNPAGATKAQLEGMGSDVNDAVAAFGNSHFKSLYNANTEMIGWTMYSYGATSVKSVAENGYVFGSAIGGTGTAALPNLVAMVQSLRSDSSGRSYRGRMYLPCNGVGLQEDGHFTSSDCDAMATATATYLEAVASAISGNPGGGDSTPCVASFTKSFCTNITSVVVDDIPDTQHRREDKLGSAYEASHPVVIA